MIAVANQSGASSGGFFPNYIFKHETTEGNVKAQSQNWTRGLFVGELVCEAQQWRLPVPRFFEMGVALFPKLH